MQPHSALQHDLQECMGSNIAACVAVQVLDASKHVEQAFQVGARQGQASM